MTGDWTPEVRQLAEIRSGGVCERCGTARADHLHHRLLRRYGVHTIANALYVCPLCHTDIHARAAESYRRGWLVRHAEDCDPVTVRVLYRGEFVHLGMDGYLYGSLL